MRPKKLEGFRQGIISDVVYKGISVKDVAKRHGVSRTTITRNLASWGVSFPVHLTTYPWRDGWYQSKAILAKDLPKSLIEMNRSDLIEFTRTYDRSALCFIFGVDLPTLENTFDYHCLYVELSLGEMVDHAFGLWENTVYSRRRAARRGKSYDPRTEPETLNNYIPRKNMSGKWKQS